MKIEPNYFLDQLLAEGIDFFTGVPDSLLKNFLHVLDDRSDHYRHIIAANEGNAVALAAGYHLASQKVPLVYLQNSGLGNIVNPILSLTHSLVYSIPMLLVIGWRGSPESPDEPQHETQGRVTESMLRTMDIPYLVIDENQNNELVVHNVMNLVLSNHSPAALLIKKNSFLNSSSQSIANKSLVGLNRESVLSYLSSIIADSEVVISTTGMISREYYEAKLRESGQLNASFMCVGSMGHASSIAAGFALSRPEKQTILLDGDGSCLMHMGALAVNSSLQLENLTHILINNSCHDSVGGQPTCAGSISFLEIAKACGYSNVVTITTENELFKLRDFIEKKKSFIEIVVSPGHRNNLLRPKDSPLINKSKFLKAL